MTLVVESFEDIALGPNATPYYPGAIRIGVTGPYTFASGVTMTAPLNNNGSALFVGDVDQGWGYPTPGDIPSGAAALVTNGYRPVFKFPTPVHTVSVTAFNDDVATALIAYDASNRVIAIATTPPGTSSDWSTHSLSITSKVAIDHVKIIGAFVYADDLAFDTAKAHKIKTSGKKDKVKGTGKDEYANGKGGNDKIDGKGGDDNLLGGAGKDKLKGGDGNDILTGDDGPDVLIGGPGTDTFIFGPLGSIDKIKDFNVAEDTMVLLHSTFTVPGNAGVLLTSEFVTGPGPVDADDHIIYNFNTGALSYDIDGNGPNAPIQFAQLSPGLPLTSKNFMVLDWP